MKKNKIMNVLIFGLAFVIAALVLGLPETMDESNWYWYALLMVGVVFGVPYGYSLWKKKEM